MATKTAKKETAKAAHKSAHAAEHADAPVDRANKPHKKLNRHRAKILARRTAAKAALPQAELNLLRMPASKVRLVVDLVRGKSVEEALNIIMFTPKYASAHLAKLLRSAVANADQKGGYDVDRLVVKEAQVGEGPMMKRFRPRAMGRAGQILKRSCHVRFVLGTVEA